MNTSDIGANFKSFSDAARKGKTKETILNATREKYLSLRRFLKPLLEEGLIEEQDFEDEEALAKKQELIEVLLREDSLEKWADAFTHESYDENNNYEFYETVGDAVLGSVFVNYISDMFPEQANARTITLSKNYYMSFNFQAMLAEEHGLNDMILLGRGVSHDRKMDEDVFEAFFGALSRIIDNVEVDGETIYRGDSYRYAYSFLHFFLKDHDVDIVSKSDPLTLIKERIDILREKMAFEMPQVTTKITTLDDGEQKLTLKLIQEKAGIPFTWATVVGSPDDTAMLRKELGERGLAYMDSLGYTEDYTFKGRRKKEELQGEFKEQVEIFEEKRKEYNITSMENHNSMIIGYRFKFLPKTGEMFSTIFYLIWRMEDGTENEVEAARGFGKTRTLSELDSITNFNEKFKLM